MVRKVRRRPEREKSPDSEQSDKFPDSELFDNMRTQPHRRRNAREKRKDKLPYKPRDFVSVRPGDTVETAVKKMEKAEIGMIPVFDGEGNNVGVLRSETIDRAQRGERVDTHFFRCNRVVNRIPLPQMGKDYKIGNIDGRSFTIVVTPDGSYDKMVVKGTRGSGAVEKQFSTSMQQWEIIDDAVAEMEWLNIPVIPVLDGKKVVGYLNLNRAKRVLDAGSEPFDPKKTRCGLLMEEPLPEVDAKIPYEEVATLAGIHGGVVVTNLEGRPTGIVSDRLVRRRGTEGKDRIRFTYDKWSARKPKGRKKGGPYKYKEDKYVRTAGKRPLGRTGMPAIRGGGMQASIRESGEPKRLGEPEQLGPHEQLGEHERRVLKRWGSQLEQLRLKYRADDGTVYSQPMTLRNQALVGLIVEEEGGTNLFKHFHLQDARNATLRLVQDYLEDNDTVALEAFKRNQGIVLGQGDSLAQRLINSSTSVPDDDIYGYDIEDVPRYPPPDSVKKGKPPKPAKPRKEKIIDALTVTWTEKGQRRKGNLLPQNSDLVVAILKEKKKTRLLKADPEDEKAQAGILRMARSYIKKHNPRMLPRFNINKPINLGRGETLDEQLTHATSPEQRGPEREISKKELEMREIDKKMTTDSIGGMAEDDY